VCEHPVLNRVHLSCEKVVTPTSTCTCPRWSLKALQKAWRTCPSLQHKHTHIAVHVLLYIHNIDVMVCRCMYIMHTNSCLLRFSMTSLQTGHTMCCKLIPYPLYRARGCEGGRRWEWRLTGTSECR
jgi:hypothetical protein